MQENIDITIINAIIVINDKMINITISPFIAKAADKINPNKYFSELFIF